MRYLVCCPVLCRLGLLLLVSFTAQAQAQAPAWRGAVAAGPGSVGGAALMQAVATDAVGNVFVTGTFTGSLAFGPTVLTSAGNLDLFVAKYVPSSNAWAWAQRGGGTGIDTGYGVAVSGSSVYVTGQFANNAGNVSAVTFGGGPGGGAVQVNGTSATTTATDDLVLAKYIDNGSTATLAWTQVGGGTGTDIGYGVAVSGSNVYVAGSLTNSTSNALQVVFGGGGTTAGTVQVNGANAMAGADLLLAKYQDNGATATLAWTQVGGGNGYDVGRAVAVSGSSVYVTGSLMNNTDNARNVVFGGGGTTAGTVQVNGASATSSNDLVLAKYTDQGSTALLGWTQVGGGTEGDLGQGIAASGTSVYVTGYLSNSAGNGNQVLFGGGGTTAGTARQYGTSAVAGYDMLLAKYTDNGPSATLAWTQVAGGTSVDYGDAVAVSGSSVYVTGTITNNTANSSTVVFGGGGTTAGTTQVNGATSTNNPDLLLAKYTDQGVHQWSQVGGGTDGDRSFGVAVSGQQVYAAGFATPPATFGPSTLTASPGTGPSTVLATLTDATLPLPTRAATAGTVLRLYPNPAPGAATLIGAVPGQMVQMLDALGRVVVTATADSTGKAALDGLASGLYVVRAGASCVRLVVE